MQNKVLRLLKTPKNDTLNNFKVILNIRKKYYINEAYIFKKDNIFYRTKTKIVSHMIHF